MTQDRHLRLEQRVRAVIDCPSERFDELVRAASLDPKRDLRSGDWSELDLSQADLRGFDFTDSDLTGARFDGALITGAIFDGAAFERASLHKAADFDAFLKGEVRRRSLSRNPPLADSKTEPRRGGEPVDVFSLLEPSSEIHGPSYLREFGAYRWTYVVGYRALMEQLFLAEPGFANLRAVTEYIKGLRVPAVNLVPDAWKARFPEGAWSSCNVAQIDAACSGAPLRFDKACQAIKALELALGRATSPTVHNIDFYGLVRLRPAIFVLGDLGGRSSALLHGGRLSAPDEVLYKGLVERLCSGQSEDEASNKRARAFLHSAAAGYGMTWANASLIKGYLADTGVDRVRIYALPDRTAGGKLKGRKRCNVYEAPFISLEDGRIKRLTGVKAAIVA